MYGVLAVSAVPIAVAFVIGVGGFAALLPFLISDEARTRAGELPAEAASVAPVPLPEFSEPSAPRRPVAAPQLPRVSRLRLAATVGALVVWSVWSVRRPFDRGRHD